MKKIYSKVNSKIILAVFIENKSIDNSRNDLSNENDFLQVNARKFEEIIEIKPHKHLKRDSQTLLTQEAWIIFKGKILAKIYDLDDSLIYDRELNEGDCTVLFQGGHSLKVLQKGTVMYEIKNGPYLGIEKDKKMIK